MQLRQIRHNFTKTPLRIPLIWWRHRTITPQDVIVASYPRSGSTWLRFLLYEILSGRSAEFNVVNVHIPRPGWQKGANRLLPNGGRLIQTHEVYRREYHRAIYLVRDVRDVVPSEYQHQTGQGFFEGSFDSFIDAFLEGRVNGYGPWHRNILSWFEAQAKGRVSALIVHFEELRRSPQRELVRVLDFLDIKSSPAQIEMALASNTVEKMREKEERSRTTVFKNWKMDAHFVRSGSATSGKGKLNDAQLWLVEACSRPAMLRAGYVPAWNGSEDAKT